MTIHLITKSAAIGGNVYSVEMPDKRGIHVLRGTELDSARFHRAARGSTQLKMYELFLEFLSVFKELI